MSKGEVYVPFSQRSGLAPIPPQLKLGEVSDELRILIDYSLRREIQEDGVESWGGKLVGEWKRIATDFHVKLLRKSVTSFRSEAHYFTDSIGQIVSGGQLGMLFDFVEFIVRHPKCSETLRSELADAFVSARSAYRIVDLQIVAIGSGGQAEAFSQAVLDTNIVGASAARQHLISAGVALRDGNWANSVRESIHSVEAIARSIDPEAKTLGPALKSLERNGYLHGSLKSAFEKLYGYTNDEGGIRHALLEDQARVDETDALFMLGACASFVSYLVARVTARSGRD